MSWTDERVEILTKMWAEGNSASQIAKELGGVTRNAVIGKVHRLGLSNRATTSTSNNLSPRQNQPQRVALRLGKKLENPKLQNQKWTMLLHYGDR